MNRLKQSIHDRFSGHRGPGYVVLGILCLAALVAAAFPGITTIISLIDSIFTSKYEYYYMVAAGIVATPLVCMAYENIFTISSSVEDPRFRRRGQLTRHILVLVLVAAGLRFLYGLVFRPSSLIKVGEVSQLSLPLLGTSGLWLYVAANCLLSVLSVLCVYFMSYILCRRWNAAFAAAMAIALWPHSLFLTTVAGTEAHLIVFLTLLAMLMGTIALYKPGKTTVPVSVVCSVIFGIACGFNTVFSFAGMVLPLALVVCTCFVRSTDKRERIHNRANSIYAIISLMVSVAVAMGAGYLIAHLTGEGRAFANIFTAGYTHPSGLLAKFANVWGGETCSVDAMMSYSAKPAGDIWASIYDSIYGSPIIFKLICQLYYAGMLYMIGRGIFMSFRNGYLDSAPARAVMLTILVSAVLTVIGPNTQIFHMPVIAAAMCLSSLGYRPVEPDYEGL